MDVRGPLPLNLGAAARAYGVARPAPAAPVAPAGAMPQDAPRASVNGLIAGTVRVAADPTNAPSLVPQAAFAMYTRAADRVEAAVQVELGRTLDVRG